MSEVNIIFVGVGGQGILFASRVISEVAFSEGLDVKTNEVHGMAQRGGSVISQVRFGEKIYSPLIKKGTSDFLLGLEKLEALRYADYLKSDGICLVCDMIIMPPSVSSGLAEYPKDIDNHLKNKFKNLFIISADKIAMKLGEQKTTNTIMLGALSSFLKFDENTYKSVLTKILKGKAVDINLKAFLEGRKISCFGMKKQKP